MTMQQEALQKEFELQKAQKDAEITVVRANAEAQAIQTQGNAIKQNRKLFRLKSPGAGTGRARSPWWSDKAAPTFCCR